MVRYLVICFVVVLLSGCATSQPRVDVDDNDSAVSQKGILRIGISPDNPPISYMENGVLKGVDVDLARKLCQRMNKQPEFVLLKKDELLPALQCGDVDVLSSSMSVGGDWKGMAMISDPYMECGQVALVRRPEAMVYDNVGILLGNPVIGVIQRSRGQDFAEKNCRKATVVECNDIEDITSRLINGQIDVALFDLPVSWWLAQNHAEDDLVCSERPITDEQKAWLVAQNNDELLVQLNEALNDALQHGIIDRLLSKISPQKAQVQ